MTETDSSQVKHQMDSASIELMRRKGLFIVPVYDDIIKWRCGSWESWNRGEHSASHAPTIAEAVRLEAAKHDDLDLEPEEWQ